MAPARILIIDDEKAIRDSFGAHLEDCGYEILTAENGRAGFSRFKKENPDLVIVDLRMPELDGIQVLERISRISPLTPLIVASGTGIITDAIDALHCGAWDYLLKPIEDLSVLTHAVAAALEKAQLKRENQAYRTELEQRIEARTAELAQANTHLSQINARLRHIVDTTRTLSFCSDVQEFGSLLLEEFGQHMLASGGSIYLKEENGLRLVHALDGGHANEFIAFPLPEGSLFQLAIAASQPLLVRNIGESKSVKPSGWEKYTDGSALVFPLPDEFGGIAGIMTLHSKTPPPFVDQDREIGTILASYSCEALRAVRATEELQENASRLRKILDTIPTGIIIIDAENHEIIYVNPTAAGMFGTDSQAITGKICHEVICPSEIGCCPMASKQIDPSERTLITVDGRKVPVLKTVSRTTLAGRECFMESFIDLSEQIRAEVDKERLELQLRQSQKMEALGTLAGGIAHDFNNILSAVLGYSELGLQDLDDPVHPLHPKLTAINHAGHRARELVEQILSFSRMREQLQSPTKISPIVKEALKLLQSSLPANIQIKADIKADRPVLGDPTQIHQIIMNLCTNAYHAMQASGGTLGVSLEQVPVDASEEACGSLDLPPGQYLRLTISDTGGGISPAIIDRIFDPYFTTKEKGKGTGLGLAVVHGIVKRHGGEISVESRVGQGTQFTVLLPVSGNKTANNDTPVVSLPRGREHVLLVDDEKDLVEIGREMLQRLGYRVTAITRSADALEIFKQDPSRFDIVVTDFNMPGLTGDQMAREMLAIRRDTPIIVCTGFSEVFDRQRAQAIGIRQTLMKPVTMEAIANTVHEVLETR